jgi:hypothetical protein
MLKQKLNDQQFHSISDGLKTNKYGRNVDGGGWK